MNYQAEKYFKLKRTQWLWVRPKAFKNYLDSDTKDLI